MMGPEEACPPQRGGNADDSSMKLQATEVSAEGRAAVKVWVGLE